MLQAPDPVLGMSAIPKMAVACHLMNIFNLVLHVCPTGKLVLRCCIETATVEDHCYLFSIWFNDRFDITILMSYSTTLILFVCWVFVLKGQDPMAVERSNLLDVFKLVVKELLDTSLSFGRMLDDTHAPLQQFFVILDHIFRHGIKRSLCAYFVILYYCSLSLCLLLQLEQMKCGR